MDSVQLREAEEALYLLLGPELSEITKIIASTTKDDNPYLISLPTAYTVDLPLEEIASLVAKTANAFGRLSRYAGIARAKYKLARGRYERKYKRARKGANEDERSANGMEAAADEHIDMITAEAIVELADSYEAAARIASESIRKIFDKALNMQIAIVRESHGKLRDDDFLPY